MSSSSVLRPGPFTSGLLAGRYRLEAELGQGGMGKLYHGIDTQTGDAVAVKALKPEIVAGNPEFVTRFVREGEALRQLNHPNIVKMLEAVSENEQHYLIMEYISGGDMRQLLDQEAPLPVSQVIEIGLDLADALTRAHRLNIIHRDLKPANVLITDDGTPKLTDFGTAHVAGLPALTQTGMIVGTVAYLSPEGCDGKRLDERADIWGFGVMLYEMLVGGRPFSGDTLAASLAAIYSQPVPDISQLRPEVPDGLADLVYRMLQKDRQNRIPSVRLVGAELEALLRGDGRPGVTSASRTIRIGETSPFATPTPPAGAIRHNLPTQPTPFVGREAELAKLAQLVSPLDTQLVTILGAGGMGKSRLALALAGFLKEQFPDGVYFVPLTGLSAPEEIVPAIAEAAGQLFSQGRSGLLDFLREKRLLLLLDNFEHLLEGVDIVSEILRTCSQVKILATSRVKLGVQGENLFPLAGMDFPEMRQVETQTDNLDYTAMDSVRLFVQSARRTKPGFELEGEHGAAVARICRLVQGMPLAIVLAAAWMEMLTPSEIATEIENSLDFLAGDIQDAPDRHRSMRAVLDHTWRQLSSRDQQLMAFTSIFRGGIIREAAQVVTGASLRELMALTSKSLLQRSPDGRFQVHELLRQYAAERLAEQPDITSQTAEEWIREQHSAYFCALLDRLAPEWKSAAVMSARTEMLDDLLNMRLAWDWAVARAQVTHLAQGLESLSLFYWYQSAYQQGEVLARQAAEKLSSLLSSSLSPSRELLRLFARLRAWQGFFINIIGNPDAALQYCQEALDVLDRPELSDQDTRAERAFALIGVGRGQSHSSREKADQVLQQSLALFQSLADLYGSTLANGALGVVAQEAFDYGSAEAHYLEAWRLSQALGHQMDRGWESLRLGQVTLSLGRFEEAENWFRQGVEICRQHIDNWPSFPTLLNSLSIVLIALGRFDEAHELLVESSRFARARGWYGSANEARVIRSETSLHLGRYEKARQELADPLVYWQQKENREWVSSCQYVVACLQVTVGNSWEASRLLRENNGLYRKSNDAENLFKTLVTQSLVASQADQLAEARLYLRQALALALEMRNSIHAITALPAMALYQTALGEKELAAELYALATVQPFVANSRWYQEVVGKRIETTDLSPEVKTDAEERGRVRKLWQTIEEFLMQLGA